ncbi:MAG: nucleotidyl transferase AbiEii/AbiGii toxin family protein [Candidatus Magasanikbacteria bacterium]|nr:nucleotidyl transferase AbiEii/AbiGii toxin family protein [Candidatus Magasanikbacteria bacterium]
MAAYARRTVTSDQLFLNRLSPATQRGFALCQKLALLKIGGWYLAGGTALALQAGHRQSVNLDFFTTKPAFNELTVERELFATGEWRTDLRERGTIFGVMGKAKMSLISYPFFLPAGPVLQCGAVTVLPPADIGAMKIIAISQRGRKRDFVDLYWLCKNRESLRDIILRAARQYPGQENNIAHLLKSLEYFVDAEEDAMPKLFFPASWAEIKKFFRREVKAVAEELYLK